MDGGMKDTVRESRRQVACPCAHPALSRDDRGFAVRAQIREDASGASASTSSSSPHPRGGNQDQNQGEPHQNARDSLRGEASRKDPATGESTLKQRGGEGSQPGAAERGQGSQPGAPERGEGSQAGARLASPGAPGEGGGGGAKGRSLDLRVAVLHREQSMDRSYRAITSPVDPSPRVGRRSTSPVEEERFVRANSIPTQSHPQSQSQSQSQSKSQSQPQAQSYSQAQVQSQSQSPAQSPARIKPRASWLRLLPPPYGVPRTTSPRPSFKSSSPSSSPLPPLPPATPHH